VDGMLHEVSEGYYQSSKKAILDYVLMDEEEKFRLGIIHAFDTVVTWGKSKCYKITLPSLPKEEI
jgi:hypothetical protein